MIHSLLHAFGTLLFALSWLAFDHYRPWVNFHSEALALLGVGLLAASRVASRKTLTTPQWIWILAAFSIVPWLQWLLGISLFSGDAVMASLYLSAFAVAIALGFSYTGDTPDRLAPLFFTLWLVALVSAAIGLLQWLTLQEPLQMYVVQTDAGDRAMGNLGQPNQLATLLLMGMAALAWTYEHRRIGPVGMVFGITFMSLGLVLSQSRAGILSAIAVALLLVWKSPQASMRLRRWQITTWLVGYLLTLQLLPWIHEFLLMPDGRNLSLTRDNGRLIIWQQMLSGIFESPWVGYGWLETPTAHAAGSLNFPGSLTYTNAHNIVLDIVAWNGVPLGIALTLLCAYWLLSRIFIINNVNSLCAMACLLPITVHSMLEYPFAYSYFLLAAGFMVGIVEASKPSVGAIVIYRHFFIALISIWSITGIYIIYEYLKIEEDFRIVRFENLRIGQTPPEYQAPRNIWLLSHMGAMLKAARQEAKRDMSARELDNLRKTSMRFPYGSLAFRYALALGLNGQPEMAARQMQIIRGMYGVLYYQATVTVLRTLEKEKYPELAKVPTP